MRIKKALCIIAYSLSLCTFTIAFVANCLFTAHISNIFLCSALILSMIGFVILSANNYFDNEKLAEQLLIIYVFLFVFISLAYFSAYTCKDNFKVLYCEMICTSYPTFVLLIKMLSSSKDFLQKRVKKVCFEYRYIFILSLLFVIFSIETLDDWPHQDALTYYTYISNAKAIDFSFHTSILLKLGGHKSYAASMFFLLGEYVTPNSPVGVRCIEIICVCLTMFMFSNILNRLELDNGNKLYNGLLCAVYAFQPLVLGTIYDINIDFMMMVFWIFSVYFYMNNEYILFLLSCLCLLLSKEVGIFIFLGIWLGVVMDKIKKGINKSFFKKILISLAPLLFISIVWFFEGNQWFSSKNSTDFSIKGNLLHKFGINFISIFCKLKEMYLMNFSWILLCIILISIIYSIVKKKCAEERPSCNESTNVIWLSYLTFLGFNFIYITYTHTRYIAPHLWIYTLFFAYAMKKLNFRIMMKKIIGTIVALLLFIQSFITIDPVTFAIFRKIDIGSSTIVSTIAYTQVNDVITTDEALINERSFSHAIEYNRQYTYFVAALENMLKTLHYTENDLVLIESIYGNSSIELTNIFMLGKEGGNNAVYYYDYNNHKLKYDNQYPVFNVLFIDNEFNIQDINSDIYEHIYVISFPYNSRHEKFSFVENIEYNEEFVIFYKNWEVDARKIK